MSLLLSLTSVSLLVRAVHGLDMVDKGQSNETLFMPCKSHSDCQATPAGSELVCCWNCKVSFCCDDKTLIFDVDRCREDPQETTSLGSKTLAIVIGSVISSFVLVLIGNWIIKQYLCKAVSRRRNNASDSTVSPTASEGGQRSTSLPGIQPAPPSYSDIELYSKVDHTKSQAIYYTVPGVKSYYGIITEWSPTDQIDVSNTRQFSTSNPSTPPPIIGTIEPPPYRIAIEESDTIS